MLINFMNAGDVLNIAFTNDIHFESSHQLEEELFAYQGLDDYKWVVIDFSKVGFVDSTGISLLLKWIYPMSQHAKVELIHVSEPVQNIFKICKLDQFAQIHS
ncbi:MAG TPA: STAS domain-containing protein [Bacillus bacterium]|nr:STAS domain-containing protein [Bacillus sp. (in: firmicutes)]